MRPEKLPGDIQHPSGIVIENRKDTIAVLAALELGRNQNGVRREMSENLRNGVAQRIDVIVSESEFDEEHLCGETAAVVLGYLATLASNNGIFSQVAREVMDSYNSQLHRPV